MAEGGEDRDKNNPFSFKSFVNKKDKRKTNNENESDDDVDIFDLPEKSSQTRRDRRDRSKQIVVVEESPAKSSKKEKAENPFSFKKFLSSSTGKNSDRVATVTNLPTNIVYSSELRDEDTVPHLHVAGDLPDFVQDHYSENIGSPPRSLELPDFTLRGITENGPDIREPKFSSQEITSTVSDNLLVNSRVSNDLVTSHDDFDDNSGEDSDVHAVGGLIQSLPDFLSDAAVSSSKSLEISPNPVISREIRLSSNLDNTNALELQRLQEENASLRRQVEELRAKKGQDAERIAELQHQLVVQKKKETEETAVMEHAMEQVEQNLSDTTKRAVKAETHVTKLKLEVKNLQTEIKILQGKNGVVSSDKHLCDVKERTSYVAEQLASATKAAETSLRQLLSGVDNLKVLSQVLTSIDKISEETSRTEQNPPHDPS